MKIAVVYNRESKKVINLFGLPNRERYGLAAITRIVNALKKGGHHVIALEGDKDLIDRLEEFMPRVVKGERPGMVFNVSYGIQGQARYTHVPSILEMVGIPYVGSGPLAHSLALDKVVAKMIFKENNISTPDFAVLSGPDFRLPDLTFPLIVKPKNEAVSLGLKIVHDEGELREATDIIFDAFRQPVLAEEYIDGREINVGLLGNDPPEIFMPAEIVFDDSGPRIYTYEDKTHRSGRHITVRCPAQVSPDIIPEAQSLALKAFKALGCYDCARVDMRLDDQGNLYVLEVNSLPSLGEHGSYVEAARYMGLDFPALVNHMVEVARVRYFGSSEPLNLPAKKTDAKTTVFDYLIKRRDQMEKRVQAWATLSSRTGDPVGIGIAVNKLGTTLEDLGLRSSKQFSHAPHAYLWENRKGFKDGTLIILHIDVPLNPVLSSEPFRLDPELLYGEGIGVSRAPLIMMVYAFRALRHARSLHKGPLGVLVYNDEGMDCAFSAETIHHASENAKQVLVLRPGNIGDKIITQRRGQRKYRIIVEGKPARPGQVRKTPDILHWVFSKLDEIAAMSSRKGRIAVSTQDIRTDAFPMLLPHRVVATMLVTYLDAKSADDIEDAIRKKLKKAGVSAVLSLLSDRPPMKERRTNIRLARKLQKIAEQWDIPLDVETSGWPSTAGLVPASIPVVCGVGPVAQDLYTAKEAVQRFSLMQRTLLLAEFLLQSMEEQG